MYMGIFSFLQTIQLQMASPSGNTIPPNGSGSVTQVINIANPQKVCTLCYVLLMSLVYTWTIYIYVHIVGIVSLSWL